MVRVTTGAGSSPDGLPSGGSIAVVVYGHEGKTGKITLQPTTDGIQHLLPNETDDFKVKFTVNFFNPSFRCEFTTMQR